MTLKLRKNKSGIYEVPIAGPDGKIHYNSTLSTDRAEAEAIVRASRVKEVERAAKIGRLQGNVLSQILVGKNFSVRDAKAAWLERMRALHHSPFTLASYDAILDRWIAEMDLAHLSPAKLEEHHITEWLDRRETKLSTRILDLSAIRHFFKFLTYNGWVLGDKSQLIQIRQFRLTHEQIEPAVKIPFTEAEIERLMEDTRPHGPVDSEDSFWHVAVAVGRWTGLRLGDICRLQWAQFNGGTLKVWTDKSNRAVTLNINEPPALVAALRYIPMLHETWCFPEHARIVLEPKNRALYSVQFGRLCQRLGIEGKSFHCLRHTYATECAKAGVPLWYISQTMGHSITERVYIHR